MSSTRSPAADNGDGNGNGNGSDPDHDSDSEQLRKSARVYKVPNQGQSEGQGQAKRGTSIVAYYDADRQLCWFKLESKRVLGKGEKGIAGYKTITEGDVTEVHRARADALVRNCD